MNRHSLDKRIFYSVVRNGMRLITILFFRIRCTGRENWPKEGGGLACANHQSFLDPLLVGLTCDRRMSYLARKSLFKFGPIRSMTDYFHAIPVDRERGGLAGLKETLKRLKKQEMVLIFPEGTRTKDGQVRRLKPGFISLARRSGVPLIPIGLDGAFQSWPRTQLLPWPQPLHVVIGKPLTQLEIKELDDEQLLAEMQKRVELAFQKANSHKQHALFPKFRVDIS
ncbi:MAG: 1-acyl-sn-glycerol-3-phosphate acyltransferase [Blastopirellula sp.]|nr:MAG: 1-acyl-sn-glycerol-3-phosphate acyltransferase [Blastopirellula sp.]